MQKITQKVMLEKQKQTKNITAHISIENNTISII
jgi:hypothetical protein